MSYHERNRIQSYRTPLVFRRPPVIVMATIDCGISAPQRKVRPQSKRWRRPKLWRARDILEARAVQGRGFRGEVKSATLARQAASEKVRAEEYRRRVRNAEWIDVLTRTRHLQEQAETRWERPGLSLPAYEEPARREWPVPIYREELETKLEFIDGRGGALWRDFFGRLGGYAVSYELKDVMQALRELDYLDFVASTCTSCGGANTALLTPATFPTMAGPCYACQRHGEPRSTLPRATPRRVFAEAIRQAGRTPFDLPALQRINLNIEATCP